MTLPLPPHDRQFRFVAAFTLVELLVAVAVMTVLATLVLGGLAGAKTRVKIDRTKSTIRKLNEIVLPQYESYQGRRVPAVVTGTGAPATLTLSQTNTFVAYVDTSTGNYYGPRAPSGAWLGPFTGATATKPSQVLAQSRLQMLRLLQVYEIPDSWGDILTGPSTVLSSTCPPFARTGPVLSYSAVKQSFTTASGSLTISTGTNGGAECLYTIAAFGGFEPGAMANFRTDEIGDRDRDGAPEFVDGWSNQIEFIRWAPGISTNIATTNPSPVQIADQTNYHDPLDPQRVENSTTTLGSGARGYALIPLIVSAGPDQTFGLTRTGSAGWFPLVGPASTNGLSMMTVTGTLGGVTITGTIVGTGTLGAVTNATAMRDEITNHDLMKK